jgi:hypothetical protein
MEQTAHTASAMVGGWIMMGDGHWQCCSGLLGNVACLQPCLMPCVHTCKTLLHITLMLVATLSEPLPSRAESGYIIDGMHGTAVPN